MAAGALNLASPEVKIHLDSAETSGPIDVEQKEQRETNSLVEEFMLLANISVAKKIQETFPQSSVLRYEGKFVVSTLVTNCFFSLPVGICHLPRRTLKNSKTFSRSARD